MECINRMKMSNREMLCIKCLKACDNAMPKCISKQLQNDSTTEFLDSVESLANYIRAEVKAVVYEDIRINVTNSCWELNRLHGEYKDKQTLTLEERKTITDELAKIQEYLKK